MKLIIRLDETLIEAKPKRDVPNKANKSIFNANRQADRATKSDVKRGERKAKRENIRENKCGDKDNATIENENKDKREDNNKSRGENKCGNVRQAIIGNRNNDIKRKVRRGRGENNFRLWEIIKIIEKYSQRSSYTYIFSYILNVPNFINNTPNISKYIILMFQI